MNCDSNKNNHHDELLIQLNRCTIKIFRGEGVVDGEGGSSERCLKWGGGRSLTDLYKNILKQGWVKAKVVRRGRGGFEGVTTPAPPPKILIVHQTNS